MTLHTVGREQLTALYNKKNEKGNQASIGVLKKSMCFSVKGWTIPFTTLQCLFDVIDLLIVLLWGTELLKLKVGSNCRLEPNAVEGRLAEGAVSLQDPQGGCTAPPPRYV